MLIYGRTFSIKTMEKKYGEKTQKAQSIEVFKVYFLFHLLGLTTDWKPVFILSKNSFFVRIIGCK